MRLPPLLLFFITGLLLYFPIFFAPFAGDDYQQLVSQPFFHTLSGAIDIFGNVIGSPFGQTSLTGFFYRPLPFALQTVLYTLFPGNPFPLHTLQLLMYIISSYLIYIFFKLFFSHKIALLLGFIFLIHPVNNDLGAYIAAFPDTLCLFFGILALIGIGQNKTNRTNSILIFATLLGSLFSKETGVIFVLLAASLSLYRQSVRKHLLPILASLAIYLISRTAAASHVLFTHLPPPTAHYSFHEHLVLSLQIAFTFLREIVMPTRAGLKPGAFDLTWENSIVPMCVLGLFFLSCAVAWRILKAQNAKQAALFGFFLSWTGMGMLLYLQIFPLEVIFADRWAYISELGMLGIMGTVCMTLPIIKHKWLPTIRMLFILLLCLYAIETLVLNGMWLDWERYFV